jgi:RHS repeat-associated protein
MFNNFIHGALGQQEITSSSQLFTITVTERKPLFAMRFQEYEPNGNIKELRWKITSRAPKYYGFSYDPLNRLTAADYGHFEVLAPVNPIVIPAPQKVPTQHYSVPSISYDAVGNITGITRMGRMPALPDNCFDKHEIDRLTMAYHPTENRLLSVQDAAPPAARHLGFKPSGGQPAPYQYDQNGNLTLDTDKSLSISYNFLNLPSQLGSLGILYDATGRKWRKAGQSTTTLYSNGIEYRDGKLEAIYLPDGRLAAEYAGSSITRYRAEYFHQDHLGNTRLAFSDFNQDQSISLHDDPATPEDELEITQEAHYYPFGMGHLGPWYESVSPVNRYLYNGKELNDEEGVGLYDYGARWYDAALGRWGQVDPLAEERNWVNPYNFVQNNPILRFDPNGLTDYTINGKGRIQKVEGTDTDEGTDRLIRGEAKYNKKGELKGAKGSKYIEVEKGVFDNMESNEERQVFSIASGDNAEKLYDFIAGYVSSEFDKIDIETSSGDGKSFFYTSYDAEKTRGGTEFILHLRVSDPNMKLIDVTHNHGDPNFDKGLMGTSSPSDSDKRKAAFLANNAFPGQYPAPTFKIWRHGIRYPYNSKGKINE